MKDRVWLAALAVFMLGISPAQAGVIFEDEFVEVGPSETLTALFVVPGSGTTANQY